MLNLSSSAGCRAGTYWGVMMQHQSLRQRALCVRGSAGLAATCLLRLVRHKHEHKHTFHPQFFPFPPFPPISPKSCRRTALPNKVTLPEAPFTLVPHSTCPKQADIIVQ